MTLMNSMRILTPILILGVLVLVVVSQPSQAFTEIRDPFVSEPIGPFTLLNNPAAAMETDDFTIRASLGQGYVGGDSSQLIAYLEPDMGTGAGALYWHGANLASGNNRRELGYIVARPVNDHLTYGVTVKHVREDEIGTWAVDLGVMSTDLSRFKGGLVVHNLVGQSPINPTHVTGALTLDLTPEVGLSASMSSPVVGDWEFTEVGVAVDVLAIQGTKLRLGRITNVSSLVGYWLTGFEVDLNSLTVDANLAFAGNDKRVTIGGIYRF